MARVLTESGLMAALSCILYISGYIPLLSGFVLLASPDAARSSWVDREVATFAIAQPFEELAAPFAELPDVLAHIAALRDDVLDNVPLFASPELAAQAGAALSRVSCTAYSA